MYGDEYMHNKLDRMEAEIQTLSENASFDGHKIEQQEKEIESLRSQLDRHLFMGESVEKIKAENEIESLRSQLAAEKAKTDIDLVNNPAAWDRLDKALKERDKWKRRLFEYKDMVESLPGSLFAPGDGILPQPLESVSYHEAIRRKYPEVDYWFRENSDES